MRNKIILSLCFILLGFGYKVYAQQSTPLLFYLNSKPFNTSKVFFNTKDITNISVKKDSTENKIFITTNNKLKFEALSEILKKEVNIKNYKSTVIAINNQIINDTTGILIDSSFFITTNIEKLSNVNYLLPKFKGLTIISINLTGSKDLYIRGKDHQTTNIIEAIKKKESN